MLPLVACLPTARAEDGKVGLGIAVGSPTGITLKVFVAPHAALDLLVGETWQGGWEDDDLLVSIDYLAHVAHPVDTPSVSLDFYVGGGANVWLGGAWTGDDRLAAEVPMGFSLRFPKASVELFLEAAPMVVVLDYRGFVMGASAGARYYF